MAQWCPRCGAEYVEGWGACSTCDVELVDEPPEGSTGAGGTEGRGRRISFLEPGGSGSPEDPFVPIWEGPTLEANALARLLERSHIPVDLGEAMSSGWSRLEVPRSYVPEAEGLIDGEGQDIPPYDFPLDDPSAEAELHGRTSVGLSTMSRSAIVVIVLIIVAMLVLARI